MHYAQRHPGLFSQVATLSGANEFSRNHAVMRAAVVATLTNIGAPLCGTSSPTCSLNFGPTVSSDAVFGTPYPLFNLDWRWNEADPVAHMDVLARAGTGVTIYTGNGGGNPAEPEFWVQSASQHAKERLDALEYPRTTWTTATAPAGARTATAATTTAAGHRTSWTTSRDSKRHSRRRSRRTLPLPGADETSGGRPPCRPLTPG
ncbi:alpha/beta hydrolase-fold protein [Streptomyces netropsis]